MFSKTCILNTKDSICTSKDWIITCSKVNEAGIICFVLFLKQQHQVPCVDFFLFKSFSKASTAYMLIHCAEHASILNCF